ncbi:hypothetical protein D3C73_1353730 [compost metagenome]
MFHSDGELETTLMRTILGIEPTIADHVVVLPLGGLGADAFTFRWVVVVAFSDLG